MKNFLNKNKYYIGALVSLVMLHLSLRGIDPNKLIYYFSVENLDILFFVIIINVVLRFLIVLRWNKLLDIIPANKFVTTFHYTNIGYFANNFLPARLGDIIKSYLLAKKNNYSKTQVFTSALIERIFDLIGLSVLFFIAILRYDIPKEILRGVIVFIGVLSIIILIILIMFKKKEFIDVRLGKISRYEIIDFIRKKISSVFYYLKNYLNIKDILYLFISSALIWFFYVFAGFIIVERLNGLLSWDASILSLIFLGVSFILPSTPGNIGVHQFACVLAFGILGLDKTQAVAFSLYYQIPVILLSVVLGLFSIYYERFSVKSISRLSKEAKPTGLDEAS